MKISASWKALAEAIEACAQALRVFYPLERDTLEVEFAREQNYEINE